MLFYYACSADPLSNMNMALDFPDPESAAALCEKNGECRRLTSQVAMIIHKICTALCEHSGLPVICCEGVG